MVPVRWPAWWTLAGEWRRRGYSRQTREVDTTEASRNFIFLAGAVASLFWLEPEPAFFGWSRSQHILDVAGVILFFTRDGASLFSSSRSQSFLSGARANLFWLEPELTFLYWSQSQPFFDWSRSRRNLVGAVAILSWLEPAPSLVDWSRCRIFLCGSVSSLWLKTVAVTQKYL